MIVTATGLKVKMLGGARVTVDGRTVNLPDTVSYKGMMYSDVPNLASSFGYTNASWTLKAELIARYVCRLLNHMRANGYDTCVPRLGAGDPGNVPAVNLEPGYIQRAAGILPKQGHNKPWKFHQNYVLDLASLKFSGLADSAMQFEHRAKPARPPRRRLPNPHSKPAEADMTPTLHLIQNVLLGVVAVLAALALFTGYVARRVTRAFPPEGRFVDIGGDRIHYVEYGNGPPIVFVHGSRGSCAISRTCRSRGSRSSIA